MPALDAGIFFSGIEEDDRSKSGHDERSSNGETVSLWHGFGFLIAGAMEKDGVDNLSQALGPC